VTPTAHDPLATIQVNGAVVASGTASAPIDLSAGSATVSIAVTAEDGTTSITYTLHITVDQTVVRATGIALSADSLRLDTTSSLTGMLVATVLPANASDQAVIWTSDTPAVATVDQTGTVRAIAAGQAVITATSHDGGFTASATVHVFSLYFTDDFEAGAGNWDLLPITGPNGTFSVVDDDTKVLKYTAGTAGGVLALVKDAVWTSVPSGDFYVEARIKPQTNSTTSVKQLYMIARYRDATD
jgi:hypothetical protein